MKTYLSILGASLALFVCSAHAENDPISVTVTADRFEQLKQEAATSVTVITSNDIERKQIQKVEDALEEAPGVDVVRSGGAGANSVVFLRGANSEHTLVIIDGIEVNDPISPTRAFNFTNLTTDNIDRIEVIRGPQSTIYGSDAMGGVINISTKKGEGTPKGFLSAEAGSYNSYLERVGVNGSESMLDYSLAASREDTDGISAAGAKYGNSEHDGFGNTALASRFGITPNELINFAGFVRYIRSIADLDNVGGVGGDDPNRSLDNDRFYSRAEINTALFEKVLKQKLGMSYTTQRFDDNNGIDEEHPADFFLSSFDARLMKFDLQNEVKISDSVQAILGAETKKETGGSSYISESSFGPFIEVLDDKSSRNNGYYAQAKWNLEKTFITTGGIRVDDHSKFGTKTTWKMGPVLLLGDTKISSTVGTGFKAPSLFQLYSSYGNPDLDPEKSLGWDAGVEQTFFNRTVTFGGTIFRTNFDNLITFDPTTFISENIAEANSKGFELYSNFKVSESVEGGLSYTYTDTEDEIAHADLLRRPKNKVGAHLYVTPCDRTKVSASLIYIGDRFDNDFSTFPATRATLGGYPVVDLAATYDITKNVQLFARVENVFDKEYEEVLGFGAKGAAAYGGIRVNL